MRLDRLWSVALDIRRLLDLAFAADTAAPGTTPGIPSAGHCAAVAVIVERLCGGRFVSTTVDGGSHWFNRIRTDDAGLVDVDLTGDQFGRDPVRIGPAGLLFPETREREESSLRAETLARSNLLSERANLWVLP